VDSTTEPTTEERDPMVHHHNGQGELVAEEGDRIVISGHRVGEPERKGLILATHPGGVPPFTIQWDDEEGERLFFPGSDAHVESRRSHGDH